MLTIFGYSAPVADIEAKKLLQLGWTWRSFIHTHHVQIYSSFYDTFLAKYPRLSCEAWLAQSFGCEFLDTGTQEADFSSPWSIKNFEELASWFSDLIKNET